MTKKPRYKYTAKLGNMEYKPHFYHIGSEAGAKIKAMNRIERLRRDKDIKAKAVMLIEDTVTGRIREVLLEPYPRS
jgi:hypothetical protein